MSESAKKKEKNRPVTVQVGLEQAEGARNINNEVSLHVMQKCHGLFNELKRAVAERLHTEKIGIFAQQSIGNGRRIFQ